MSEIIVNAVKITDDCSIEFISNPKRPGFKAHARYENYMVATTIAEYMELCEGEIKYAKPDLRYDEEHGYLKVMNAEGEQINLKAE